MGKRIEADHVVEDRMIISCNDRSTIKIKWKIDLAIAEDLNLMEFRKELLQFKFARLYFKIHPKLKPQIIPQYHNFTSDTNVKVIIV